VAEQRIPQRIGGKGWDLIRVYPVACDVGVVGLCPVIQLHGGASVAGSAQGADVEVANQFRFTIGDSEFGEQPVDCAGWGFPGFAGGGGEPVGVGVRLDEEVGAVGEEQLGGDNGVRLFWEVFGCCETCDVGGWSSGMVAADMQGVVAVDRRDCGHRRLSVRC